MRFSVEWWDSEGLKTERCAILDDAIARAEALWAAGNVLKVTVLIDRRDVVWEKPVR
jgi:hypothetical protein